MKKAIHLAFIYAILAMIGGVFYREFTKLSNFQGTTTLAFVHTHLFLLGMFMMLICTIFIHILSINTLRRYSRFLWIYNIGVVITVIMLIVRGIVQVRGSELTAGMNGMISGIAGMGHILTGIGMILFFLLLQEAMKKSHTLW